MKDVYIMVPSSSSIGQLKAWGKEVGANEKIRGKRFTINFYIGGNKPENRIGRYMNGKVYMKGDPIGR